MSLINKFLFKNILSFIHSFKSEKGNTIRSIPTQLKPFTFQNKIPEMAHKLQESHQSQKGTGFCAGSSLGLRSASTYSTEISWYSLGCLLAVKVFQCSPAYKTHFIKYQTRAAGRLHLYAKHGQRCKRKIRNFPTVKKLHFYLQNSKLAFQTKKRWEPNKESFVGIKRNPCAFPDSNGTTVVRTHPQ